RQIAATLALAALLGASGCSGDLELRTVPLVAQPKEAEPVTVPFPPPPARADVILDAPLELKSPAWIDGQWKWRGRRWVWEPGRWVDFAPNQVYSPPYVVRRADGELLWYVGILWYEGAPPPPCAAPDPATESPGAASPTRPPAE